MYKITVNYLNDKNPYVFTAEEIFGITVGLDGVVDFSVLTFGYLDGENPVIEYIVPTRNVLYIHTEYDTNFEGEVGGVH